MEQELWSQRIILAVAHKAEEMVCDVSEQISSITWESFKSGLLEENIYSVH